jgi:hypothetical protein
MVHFFNPSIGIAGFRFYKTKKVVKIHKGQSLVVFSAGIGYPQIWIRDFATVVQAAYYILGDVAACGSIEIHLRNQRKDGSIYDWINSKGEYDKNTVETDQESSLVIAVAEYVTVSGDFCRIFIK